MNKKDENFKIKQGQIKVMIKILMSQQLQIILTLDPPNYLHMHALGSKGWTVVNGGSSILFILMQSMRSKTKTNV